MNSSQKFQSDSYCVGGRHKSATKNIVDDITINKKTGREFKLLVGKCAICKRKKSMIVSYNVIQAEGLGDFFKNLGKFSARAGKKLATNILKNPGRALEIGANVATVRQPKVQKQLYQHCPK